MVSVTVLSSVDVGTMTRYGYLRAISTPAELEELLLQSDRFILFDEVDTSGKRKGPTHLNLRHVHAVRVLTLPEGDHA